MKKILSVLLALCMLATMIAIPAVATETPASGPNTLGAYYKFTFGEGGNAYGYTYTQGQEATYKNSGFYPLKTLSDTATATAEYKTVTNQNDGVQFNVLRVQATGETVFVPVTADGIPFETKPGKTYTIKTEVYNTVAHNNSQYFVCLNAGYSTTKVTPSSSSSGVSTTTSKALSRAISDGGYGYAAGYASSVNGIIDDNTVNYDSLKNWTKGDYGMLTINSLTMPGNSDVEGFATYDEHGACTLNFSGGNTGRNFLAFDILGGNYANADGSKTPFTLDIASIEIYETDCKKAYVDGEMVSAFSSDDTADTVNAFAPAVPDGTTFSGWFVDEALTTPLTAENVAGATAFYGAALKERLTTYYKFTFGEGGDRYDYNAVIDQSVTYNGRSFYPMAHYTDYTGQGGTTVTYASLPKSGAEDIPVMRIETSKALDNFVLLTADGRPFETKPGKTYKVTVDAYQETVHNYSQAYVMAATMKNPASAWSVSYSNTSKPYYKGTFGATTIDGIQDPYANAKNVILATNGFTWNNGGEWGQGYYGNTADTAKHLKKTYYLKVPANGANDMTVITDALGNVSYQFAAYSDKAFTTPYISSATSEQLLYSVNNYFGMMLSGTTFTVDDVTYSHVYDIASVEIMQTDAVPVYLNGQLVTAYDAEQVADILTYVPQTEAGKAFTGWYIDETLTTPVTAENAATAAAFYGETYVAASVEFMVGDTVLSTVEDLKAGADYAINTVAPNTDKAYFYGWYDNAELTGEAVHSNFVLSAGANKLYAKMLPYQKVMTVDFSKFDHTTERNAWYNNGAHNYSYQVHYWGMKADGTMGDFICPAGWIFKSTPALELIDGDTSNGELDGTNMHAPETWNSDGVMMLYNENGPLMAQPGADYKVTYSYRLTNTTANASIRFGTAAPSTGLARTGDFAQYLDRAAVITGGGFGGNHPGNMDNNWPTQRSESVVAPPTEEYVEQVAYFTAPSLEYYQTNNYMQAIFLNDYTPASSTFQYSSIVVEQISGSVDYILDGASVADEKVEALKIGSAYTLAYTPADTEDKVFDGWYSDPEYTTKVTEVTVAENTKVYGRMLAKPSVNFVYNSEAFGEPIVNVTPNSQVTLDRIVDNTETAYFDGWYTDPTCTGYPVNTTFNVGTTDVTLYAKMQPYASNMTSHFTKYDRYLKQQAWYGGSPYTYYKLAYVYSMVDGVVYDMMNTVGWNFKYGGSDKTVDDPVIRAGMNTGLFMAFGDDGEPMMVKPNTAYRVALTYKTAGTETTHRVIVSAGFYGNRGTKSETWVEYFDGVKSIAGGGQTPAGKAPRGLQEGTYDRGTYFNDDCTAWDDIYMTLAPTGGEEVTVYNTLTTGSLEDMRTNGLVPTVMISDNIKAENDMTYVSLTLEEIVPETAADDVFGTTSVKVFKVADSVLDDQSYQLSYNWRASGATGLTMGVFTADADDMTSNRSFVEGENVAVYTLPATTHNKAGNKTGVFENHKIFFTTKKTKDVNAGVSQGDALYVYIMDGGNGFGNGQLADFELTALTANDGSDLVKNAGVSRLDTNDQTVTQALRYYYSYNTTADGANIVVDGKAYTVVERGFLYRNGDKITDENGFEDGLTTLTGAAANDKILKTSTSDFSKCWTVEDTAVDGVQNITFSAYVTGFAPDTVEGNKVFNNSKRLLVRGYVTFTDDSGNTFTLYGDAINMTVAEVASTHPTV